MGAASGSAVERAGWRVGRCGIGETGEMGETAGSAVRGRVEWRVTGGIVEARWGAAPSGETLCSDCERCRRGRRDTRAGTSIGITAAVMGNGDDNSRVYMVGQCQHRQRRAQSSQLQAMVSVKGKKGLILARFSFANSPSRGASVNNSFHFHVFSNLLPSAVTHRVQASLLIVADTAHSCAVQRRQ